MSRKHTVEQGEDLLSICLKYGLPATKVENYGANSDLWSDTRDSEILQPGDELDLVEPEPKSEIAPT